MGMEVEDEGNGLDSLSQAHLISKDRIPVLVPTFDQPVQALQLEIFEHPVILVDGYVLPTVLSRLLGQPCIKEVQFGLHLTNILIDIALPLTGDLVKFHQEFMDLIVDLHLFSYLSDRDLVP